MKCIDALSAIQNKDKDNKFLGFITHTDHCSQIFLLMKIQWQKVGALLAQSLWFIADSGSNSCPPCVADPRPKAGPALAIRNSLDP